VPNYNILISYNIYFLSENNQNFRFRYRRVNAGAVYDILTYKKITYWNI